MKNWSLLGASVRPCPRHASAVLTLMVGLATVLLPASCGMNRRIDSYVDPGHARVDSAGFEVKTHPVGDVLFSYAEGPAHGPPLVLLHAQHLDWFSYHEVLPSLADRYHVFVVDYAGHGETTTSTDYPMNADRIGTDLAAFVEETIGKPAFISGNSSGGLLAVWLAANHPELVRAIVLEDPPLFASEPARIRTTAADRSFATASRAVADGADDFLLYWVSAHARFFRRHAGPGTTMLLRHGIRRRRKSHPEQPVDLGFVPDDTVRMLLRGLDRYDPRFGAAFHDGTWQQGFDHAAALSAIDAPTLLLHADFHIREDGTLDGAMSDDDASRALSLLAHGRLVRVPSTHVINLAHPAEFIRLLDGFFLGELAGSHDAPNTPTPGAAP